MTKENLRILLLEKLRNWNWKKIFIKEKDLRWKKLFVFKILFKKLFILFIFFLLFLISFICLFIEFIVEIRSK